MTARSLHEGRHIPAHPDDVRQGLREAAERRGMAERDRAMALQDLGAWLVAAYEIDADDGITFREAVRLAGVSTRTAYRMLAAHGVEMSSGDTDAAE